MPAHARAISAHLRRSRIPKHSCRVQSSRCALSSKRGSTLPSLLQAAVPCAGPWPSVMADEDGTGQVPYFGIKADEIGDLARFSGGGPFWPTARAPAIFVKPGRAGCIRISQRICPERLEYRGGPPWAGEECMSFLDWMVQGFRDGYEAGSAVRAQGEGPPFDLRPAVAAAVFGGALGLLRRGGATPGKRLPSAWRSARHPVDRGRVRTEGPSGAASSG